MNWFWQGFWGVPNFGRLSLFQWLRLTVVTTVCSVKVLKVCPWSMMANGCGPWTYIFNMISIFKTSSRNIYSIYYIYPPNKNERAMAISQNGWQHVDNAYCLFPRLKVCWSENFDLRVFETLIDGSKYAWTLPIFEFPRAQGQGFFFFPSATFHTTKPKQVTRWPGFEPPHVVHILGHHGEARPSSSQDLELVQHVYFWRVNRCVLG